MDCAAAWSSWLPDFLGGNGGSSSSQPQLSPAQQAQQAARNRQAQVRSELGPPPVPPTPPKGVYIHGSVGSGKTLLMDMLNEAVQQHVGLQYQRRMHFNHAMLEVHSRLHLMEKKRMMQRQQLEEQMAAAVPSQDQRSDPESGNDNGEADGLAEEGVDDAEQPPKRRGLMGYWDAETLRQKQAKQAQLAIRRHMRQAKLTQFKPHALAGSSALVMRQVAASFIRGAPGDTSTGWGSSGPVAAMLCFDEMQVADTFAAAALKSIFQALLQEGCVVVTTSNRAPWELNSYGFHEDLFRHFVQQLMEKCDVVSLSSEVDYRRLLGSSTPPPQHGSRSYFCPMGPGADAALEAQWSTLQGAERPVTVPVMFGRYLDVPRSRGGAAWLPFQQLCARPLGAADYAALATAFHTVFISDIPIMSMQTRDQARRFITLVDELYNARVRLAASAAAPPDLLFTGDHDEPIIDVEGLQFETAVEGSRLRRNLMSEGSVAPVIATKQVMAQLGGEEERFAFRRAISRLHEMQTPWYLQSRQRF